eukprot:5846774-Pyramimonas_sp.AAC.1
MPFGDHSRANSLTHSPHLTYLALSLRSIRPRSSDPPGGAARRACADEGSQPPNATAWRRRGARSG